MSKKSKPRNKASVHDREPTSKELATQALKDMHSHPFILHTPFLMVSRLAENLRLLSQKCDDNVRAVALEAAVQAAERITGNELKAVLAALAGIELEVEVEMFDAPWGGEGSDCDRRYLEAVRASSRHGC